MPIPHEQAVVPVVAAAECHPGVVSVWSRTASAYQAIWYTGLRYVTPPVIAQRSPLPGSTVVGATPIGFAVSDEGTGVDDDTLRVTVDGTNPPLPAGTALSPARRAP